MRGNVVRFWIGTGLCAAAITVSGCRDGGSSGDGDGDSTSDDGGDSSDGGGLAPPTDVDGVGRMGARRLTAFEYDNTVRDVLGDTTRPGGSVLPEDRRTPFDNAFANQEASRVLVEGAEALARDVAQRAVADVARRDIIVGCSPADAADAECMRSFVQTQGRRMLRRPLTTQEEDDFVALGLDFAGQGGAFDQGVEVVVRALLQDPEFLYRVEVGTPVEGRPDLFRLSDFEVASRMSYLIWGSTPDDGLLDWADLGLLGDAASRREAATMMLADKRARTQVDRFHALWLGYDRLPHPAALTTAMRTESAKLVERVIFEEQGDWEQVFTSPETYLTETLAEHYELQGAGWVDVSAQGRLGILSHGSFLSVASNVDDTSPTKRGKIVRERLMCQAIPPPPPDVMADTPPTSEGGECRLDEYRAHRDQGSCAGCHALMDDVGFGLEAFDQLGRFREFEYLPEGLSENPACPVDGEGEVTGVGSFNGPAGLAQLLVDKGIVQACVVEQVYAYAMGHPVATDDKALVDDLVTSFEAGGRRFDALILDLIGDEAFAYRTQEEG